jgi:LPS sulfotransferase NodH
MLELNIGYQKRDFDFFNYDLYTLTDPETKKSFVLRGPASPTLESEQYFSSIGPAFTYGCYTHHPYTQMIAKELKFPGINLGVQGAGPSHYLHSDNQLLLDIINRSKFAIVAVMSGRSVSNSLFEVSPASQEKLRLVGEKNYQPAHKLYEWLLKNKSLEEIQEIIAETRNNFVQEYIKLLSKIEVPKILLWFSKREPEYQERYDGGVWQLLGKFPHLVNQQMIDAIKEHSDEYVECITKVGTPQILFDRFSGQPGTVKKDPDYGYSTSNYNMYYASPEMHLDATNKLLEPCSKYVKHTDHRYSNFIQVRELIANLEELHFEKFLLSTESTESVVISEIEIKNYLFEKHSKVFRNLILSHDLVYLPKDNNDSTNFIDFSLNDQNKSKSIKNNLRNLDQYFDFVYDILPFLISKPTKVKIDHLIATKNHGNNPTNLFAVVCTPRSGSSFLCDLLKRNGGGNPLEHLRSPLLYIIKHRQRLNIDLELLLRKILYVCSENRLFGTKVISHFFFDLLVMLDQDEMEKLMSFFRHFKIIYLYRKNKTAQAISKFLASKSHFWHSTSLHRSLSEYQEQVQGIEYDFANIKEIYEKLIADEKRLENFIERSGFKEIIKIDYDSLKENPEAEMKKITNFLKIESKEIKLQSDFQVLSSDHSEELIARFNQEYNCQHSIKLQVQS